MKIDPYKHQERYIAWKKTVENGIPAITKENSEIIIRFLEDMEIGLNVASKSAKGARSYIRLNTLRDKLTFFAKHFLERYNLQRITDVSEDRLIKFFSDIRNGVIKRIDGEKYLSVDTFVKVFKSFWHWHQKTSKKKGLEVLDITADLDTTSEKPDWVYLTEDQVKIIAENANLKHKILIYFLFDTGIRAPTELVNIRVSDFFNDFKELNIREEISKTFGRRIKLMICSDLIKQYVKNNNLQPDDQLFNICPSHVNRYLKNLAKSLFGDKESPAGQKYSQLTMYDFRHCSCCYWLPRYKSESALKYRFGWKKSDKIHYYSELLGMKDTIEQQDLLVDVTKTEIEQQLEKARKENDLLQEKIKSMEFQMTKILEVVNKLNENAISI